jgi:hypothetical protein
MNTLLAMLMGSTAGWVLGSVVKHPKIGAGVGALAGYIYASPNAAPAAFPGGSGKLQVPEVTITGGP